MVIVWRFTLQSNPSAGAPNPHFVLLASGSEIPQFHQKPSCGHKAPPCSCKPIKRIRRQKTPNSVGGRKPMLRIQTTLCVGPHTKPVPYNFHKIVREGPFITFHSYDHPRRTFIQDIQALLMRSIFKISTQGPQRKFEQDLHQIFTHAQVQASERGLHTYLHRIFE